MQWKDKLIKQKINKRENNKFFFMFLRLLFWKSPEILPHICWLIFQNLGQPEAEFATCIYLFALTLVWQYNVLDWASGALQGQRIISFHFLLCMNNNLEPYINYFYFQTQFLRCYTEINLNILSSRSRERKKIKKSV